MTTYLEYSGIVHNVVKEPTFVFNYTQKRNIKNNNTKQQNIALCAIAKNENVYIREWVEYYKQLGIDKIFLYDNNDDDTLKFEYVINDYILYEYVKVINVRNKKVIQPNVYIELYEKEKYNYDWIMFFDIDEFLYLRNTTLKTYLLKFNDVDCIFVNWEIYGDSDNVKYEDKPVLQRFIKQAYKIQYNDDYNRTNYQVKSIVKCSNKKLLKCTTHKFIFNHGVYSDADMNIINDPKKPDNWSISCIKHNNMYLKHFLTKSTEEFFERMKKRLSKNVLYGQQKYNFKQCIRNYYLFNIPTPEKQKVIKEIENSFENQNEEIKNSSII